jgi:CheY-like chemotaxis protein
MDFTDNDIKALDILLVEDDEVDVMNVERSFKKNKIRHHLRHAADGIKALEMLREDSAKLPQIILLDINMPRMSGLEFLKVLRADPRLKSITVFIMSTSSDSFDKETAYQYNVAGYIVKPLSAEKFNQSIAKMAAFWDICEFE